jgi:hypothetical protein
MPDGWQRNMMLEWMEDGQRVRHRANCLFDAALDEGTRLQKLAFRYGFLRAW